GKKDDRQLKARFHQALLELQPRESGHAQVEQDATGALDTRLFEESFRRVIERDAIAGRRHQPLHRVAPGSIVVDHMHRGCHARWVSANGSVNVKTAPPVGELPALIWPPCASIMVRDMARPSPIPELLVVTNGSKMCGSTSLGMPGPESATDTSAVWPF